MKYVNVYQVRRLYGGPEEGGWWFNHFEATETRTAHNKRIAKKIKKQLVKKYAPLQRGDINSMRGDDETYDVYVEGARRAYETKHWPHYE